MIKIINWKSLSFFGKNKIINRSYIYLFIVPVFAKLLSKVNSPLIINWGGRDIHLEFELPFSWKMFFFSALLFSIGSLLYGMFAPLIIKENRSYGGFIEDKKNYTHLFDYLSDLGINMPLLTKLNVDIKQFGKTHFHFNLKKINYSRFQFVNTKMIERVKLLEEISSDQTKFTHGNEAFREQSFWTIYEFAKQERPFWLIVATLFYSGGFVLISLVILQGLRLVLKL